MKYSRFFVIPMLVIACTALLFGQEFLIVQLDSSSNHYLISNINAITFTGSDLRFSMDGGEATTESIPDIRRITFGSSLMGDPPAVAVEPAPDAVDAFILSPNYPNPFNPGTRISYELAQADFVSVKIYDINGRLVERLVDRQQQPGRYQLEFHARDLASGVYFCRISAGQQTKRIKMLLVK